MLEIIEGSFSAGQNRDGLQHSFSEIKKALGNFNIFSPMSAFNNKDKTNDLANESKWLYELKEKVKLARKRSLGTLIIGGDHSIGMATVSGVLEASPQTAVLWIDAHSDYNNYKISETKNLHGMPLNALVDGGEKAINSNFKWLRAILPPEQIALVGLRDVDPLEKQLLEKDKIASWWADDIREKGWNEIICEIKQTLNPSGVMDYHFSLDVDFFDPYVFPQTGSPVNNGFNLDEASILIERFLPKSLDIVEWNPLIKAENCHEKILQLIEIFEECLDFRSEASESDILINSPA